jgi:hypothetical protein
LEETRKTNRKDDKMKLTTLDILNILDALEEWNFLIEPKELKDNEIGLNAERYEKLIKKLEKQVKKKGL